VAVKNLQLVSTFLRQILGSYQYSKSLKWLQKLNAFIGFHEARVTEWIDALISVDFSIESELVFDMYREHLRGTEKAVHTVRVEQIKYLRWMFLKGTEHMFTQCSPTTYLHLYTTYIQPIYTAIQHIYASY
jgi:hypothetical protein